MGEPARGVQPIPGRLPLMQFWDTPVAPPDVARLMSSWRDDSQFDHRVFDHESARAFVRDHFDRRTLSVYDTCAVPKMQSDVFRLCWLFETGGIYVDADQGNKGANESFTDAAVRGHLFFGKRRAICNGLMSFWTPQDPLVGALLERVSMNVERRSSNSVWAVTGPGVCSKLYEERGADDPLFVNVRIHSVLELARAMNFVRCDYKSSPAHGPNTNSIYRTAI